MKLARTVTIVVALLMIGSFAAVADDAKEEAKQEPAKELKNQTHCPVMGGPIDSTTFTDIQGQRVYHCCPMCSKPMKEDPDKYFKKAAAEGVLFENIQTTCPVSGEELKDKSVFTDYEGRRIAFCCDKCVATFDKDPQKYLDKLDAPAEEVEEKEEGKKEMTGHEGHGH